MGRKLLNELVDDFENSSRIRRMEYDGRYRGLLLVEGEYADMPFSLMERVKDSRGAIYVWQIYSLEDGRSAMYLAENDNAT
jgi:hypothetical protein